MQDLEKNKFEILNYCNSNNLGIVEFVEEIISGKKSWKERKIFEIINTLTAGDSIVVAEVSRLGRMLLEIMEMLSIAIQKGITVHAVKENWRLDNSAQNQFLVAAYSFVATVERQLISLRTKEALASIKASGKQLGRPKGSTGKSRLDVYEPEIQAFLRNGSTIKFIAQRCNVSYETLRNYIKKRRELL
jgi:DNA invertase Pin-like site-specific DNA recombinase